MGLPTPELLTRNRWVFRMPERDSRSVDFLILDDDGNRIGVIRGRHGNVFVHDSDGRDVVSRVNRPELKPYLVIQWLDYRTTQEVGRITKGLRVGKARFALQDGGGAELGSMSARTWLQTRFSICNAAGVEVARFTKTILFAPETYVLQVTTVLSEVLRPLVVAAAAGVVVDHALRRHVPPDKGELEDWDWDFE
jgi:hypothetical protein